MADTDRELLQAAARAAGIELAWLEGRPFYADSSLGNEWVPLEDSGQALELAVKLRIELCFGAADGRDWVFPADIPELVEFFNDDPMAATRRAIVLAAAACAPQPKE